MSQQDELKDSDHVENYDIERTITKVRSAGKQLCDDTASATNRFRMSWVESFIERCRRNPGRPVVHLSDLLDSTQVGVGSGARLILLDYWGKMRGLSAALGLSERLRGIRDLAGGRPARYARLETWRFFGSLSGFRIDDLEPHVIALRISGGRHMRTVEHPKLPFNLATISGARLIGYQGDANSRNAAFTNKDELLHSDYAKCVRDVVGGITITKTVSTRGGFGEGSYLRTNVGKLITSITRVAGLDVSVDQKLANNPLPLWFHNCNAILIAACISALWDAEGSVNFHDVKTSQAVPFDVPSLNEIPRWPLNIPFGRMSHSSQEKLLETPPLLLVSTALLLRRIRVISRLCPSKASMTSTGPTAYWQLRIGDVRSIETFRSQVRLLSARKAEQLASSI
ncbi:MAG TPA: hypothetical protein VGR56_01495 [Nitrososphaerales archaeon]|nr:hypothetical protein [Nitrososphaerales archaeon]